jgi:hypothetical protein
MCIDAQVRCNHRSAAGRALKNSRLFQSISPPILRFSARILYQNLARDPQITFVEKNFQKILM